MFLPLFEGHQFIERKGNITRHHMTSHRLTSRKMGTNSDEENETRGTVSFLTSLCSPQEKCCESGQQDNWSIIIMFYTSWIIVYLCVKFFLLPFSFIYTFSLCIFRFKTLISTTVHTIDSHDDKRIIWNKTMMYA